MKKNWLLLTLTLIGLTAVNTSHPMGSRLSRLGWGAGRPGGWSGFSVPRFGPSTRQFAPTRATVPTTAPVPQPSPVVQPIQAVNPWAIAALIGSLGGVGGATLWDQYERHRAKQYASDYLKSQMEWDSMIGAGTTSFDDDDVQSLTNAIMLEQYNRRLNRPIQGLRGAASSAWQQSSPTRQGFMNRLRTTRGYVPSAQEVKESMKKYFPPRPFSQKYAPPVGRVPRYVPSEEQVRAAFWKADDAAAATPPDPLSDAAIEEALWRSAETPQKPIQIQQRQPSSSSWFSRRR